MDLWSGSDALRAKYRAAGVELPALSVALRRKGRDFPAFIVKPADAIAMWRRLRALTEQTGYYPLIVRDEHGMLSNLADAELDSSPEQVLEAAAQIDAREWLRRKGERDEDADSSPPREPGAVGAVQEDFAVLSHRGGDRSNLFMMLVPTRDGTEAPALLMYGGWNACPNPEVHVALLRYWRDKYGAEIVALTGDTIECQVARPPQSADDALELATEQFLYCTDIVYQGTESLDALASCLLGSNIWFFWWD